MDARPLHRPCSAYYVSSINNSLPTSTCMKRIQQIIGVFWENTGLPDEPEEWNVNVHISFDSRLAVVGVFVSGLFVYWFNL